MAQASVVAGRRRLTSYGPAAAPDWGLWKTDRLDANYRRGGW